jgi:RNA polymerase sigma-70 factor (ECF subfamily)
MLPRAEHSTAPRFSVNWRLAHFSWELFAWLGHYKGERITPSMPDSAPNQPPEDVVALAAMSDEHLMAFFRCGNSGAFSELFRRYSAPVYGFFQRRIENPSRAEELSQEAFIAILRGIERYEPRATFRTYLYSIAMRMVMAERRKSSRFESSLAGAPDPSEGPCVDEAIWVRRAFEQLDTDHREILFLREYEQLTYDEIAALLCLPVNTVRSRLFRARTALKGFLLPLRPDMRNQP